MTQTEREPTKSVKAKIPSSDSLFILAPVLHLKQLQQLCPIGFVQPQTVLCCSDSALSAAMLHYQFKRMKTQNRKVHERNRSELLILFQTQETEIDSKRERETEWKKKRGLMAKVLHLYHACMRERAIEWLTTATTAVKILLENSTPMVSFHSLLHHFWILISFPLLVTSFTSHPTLSY